MTSTVLESKVITLRKPIITEGNTISELTIREPTAFELEAAEEAGKTSDTARTIKLVSLAANVHPKIVKNLLGSDLLRANRIISDFLDIGQEDGEPSSPT
jgi:hypothetical protein